MPDNQPSNEPDSGWQYTPEQTTAPQADEPAVASPEAVDVTWTASEYIAHEKGAAWFVVTGLVILSFAAIIYVADSDHGWFSPLIIIIMGITFMVAANRTPKILDYTVDSTGLHAGSHLYRFSEFKSFSIVQEGAIESIVLTPLKRFMPGMTIYFEPKDQDKIVDALSNYLPHETRKLDPIDNLMRKIRF